MILRVDYIDPTALRAMLNSLPCVAQKLSGVVMALRNMRIWRYIEEVARIGSVRQAAERLHVTPSALLRRIQDVELDLGAAIFDRNSSGVRLTAAGEILVHWIQTQNADLRRVYSQIEELSGLRRGEVRISCSQAVARNFLLNEITAFRQRYPQVAFTMFVSDHTKAMQSLMAYGSDLILVFRPPRLAELQPIMSIGQGLVAIMASDHPLASRQDVRIRDCAQYDVALPDRSFSGREIIEDVLATGSAKLNVVFEANSFDILCEFVKGTQAITFQIEIGALGWRDDPGLAIRSISDLDAAHGPLVLGQLKGRVLPLAAATFAEQVARRMDEIRGAPTLAPD
jgi:DNA-binding transcriptional LysR family regulator